MSTPTPVYTTWVEKPWVEDDESNEDLIAQLKIGPHVILEVPFYGFSDRQTHDEQAAELIAEKLGEILGRKPLNFTVDS